VHKRNILGRNYFGDLSIDDRTKLKWILKKWVVKMWIELKWFRIESNGRLPLFMTMGKPFSL
jgi:hypothetical protein